jgi:hypothetical protein
MRLHWALLAFVAFQPLSVEASPHECASTKLPIPVQQLLDSKYRDWRPKMLSDLEGDDQKLWSTSNPHSCPGLAVGSFEAPHQRAYAFLLVPKSGAEDQYKIVVIAQRKGSAEYHTTVLDHGPSTHNSGMVISRVPPSKQTGFDETKSVILRLDGVNVEWLEKSSVLYYFSSGKYHELQTSD